jgi:hypothetical protein
MVSSRTVMVISSLMTGSPIIRSLKNILMIDIGDSNHPCPAREEDS